MVGGSDREREREREKQRDRYQDEERGRKDWHQVGVKRTNTFMHSTTQREVEAGYWEDAPPAPRPALHSTRAVMLNEPLPYSNRMQKIHNANTAKAEVGNCNQEKDCTSYSYCFPAMESDEWLVALRL